VTTITTPSDLRAALLRRSSEVPSLSLLGTTITPLIGSDDSDGHLMLLRYTAPAGFAGPPPHVHERTDEAFHILSGTLTVTVGDRTLRAQAGDVAFVPRGVPHAFANPDPEPVTMLVIMTPAGFEEYFQDLAGLVDSGLLGDPAAMAELATRYDSVPVT
jgi:mannose-6-phosphate isomerase-like protein (cupin superfamily)